MPTGAKWSEGLFVQLPCSPQPRSFDPPRPHSGFPRLGPRLQAIIVSAQTAVGEGPAADQHRCRQILAKHAADANAMLAAVMLPGTAGHGAEIKHRLKLIASGTEAVILDTPQCPAGLARIGSIDAPQPYHGSFEADDIALHSAAHPAQFRLGYAKGRGNRHRAEDRDYEGGEQGTVEGHCGVLVGPG